MVFCLWFESIDSSNAGRVGEWQTSRKATLKGWKLIFNVDSKRWGKGAANIVETEDPNDIVYGGRKGR